MTAPLTPCEYKTGRTLGNGSYATVKEAVKISTSEKYAVKVISKKLMQGREFMILNEIDVLKRVSKGHANIVTLWDYFETPNNLYLVMDLCKGGELFDHINQKGSFYENEAAEIIYLIVDAVAHLHRQNIVHRDIKPENVLFKNKEKISDLVIADFGLSKIIDVEMDTLMTLCGTPGYMAPEVLLKKGHGKAVDLWSIGVLAFFILCGYTPFDFDGPSNADELQNVLNARYSFAPEYWSNISDSAKDFISKLLLVDPRARMTAEDALQHPWIKSRATESHPQAAPDLLPMVRERFNARKTFKKAIEVVKIVNKLTHAPHHDKPQNSSLHPEEDPVDNGHLMVLNRSSHAQPEA